MKFPAENVLGLGIINNIIKKIVSQNLKYCLTNPVGGMCASIENPII
jgi:hypothetical protein